VITVTLLAISAAGVGTRAATTTTCGNETGDGVDSSISAANTSGKTTNRKSAASTRRLAAE
jgi:hypothetical protein